MGQYWETYAHSSTVHHSQEEDGPKGPDVEEQIGPVWPENETEHHPLTQEGDLL